MELKELFEEISKLPVEEKKICVQNIEGCLRVFKSSYVKGFTEEERVEWLSNVSDAVKYLYEALETYRVTENNDYNSTVDNENQMKR